MINFDQLLAALELDNLSVFCVGLETSIHPA